MPGMADAVEARRIARGLSTGKLAELVGVSRQALVPVRKGLRRDYNDDTIFGVARALRWPVDWYERLKGGEPPMDEDDPDHADLEQRLDQVEEELRSQRAALLEILRRLDAQESDG